MQLRDRDAPITPEGLTFRTYGYDHPPDSCFCDLEYAPETVYTTDFIPALRNGREINFYKFYFDGGLNFVKNNFPHYQILHKPLNQVLVGIESSQILDVIRPQARLQELVDERDALVDLTQEVLDRVTEVSSLKLRDFGVFGSLAHKFHNTKYSDIDLIIYGKKELIELRETLRALYRDGFLKNEFDGWSIENPPLHWNFTRYSKERYGWYQKRKLIYATCESRDLGRRVKIEFEPVRKWREIDNEYSKTKRIKSLGRVEAVVEILSDDESGFMPSLYPVNLKEIDANINSCSVSRIISYVEEFRLQAFSGETVLVRGNLERVETYDEEFYQITLSYGRDYFDQVLKLVL